MKCSETKLVELIQGNLTPEESRNALRHLETCPCCRERAKVMAVLEKIVPNRRCRRREWKIYLLAAGLLFCALVPAMVRLRQEIGSRPNALIQITESKPYPYFPLFPRSEETVTARRKRAFQAYISEDYRSALVDFNLLEADPEILFYKGICEYQLGRNEAALTHLTMAASREKRWKAPALWYKANLYLRINEQENARRVLEQLSRSGEEYASEAAFLLKRLRDWQQKGQVP